MLDDEGVRVCCPRLLGRGVLRGILLDGDAEDELGDAGDGEEDEVAPRLPEPLDSFDDVN